MYAGARLEIAENRGSYALGPGFPAFYEAGPRRPLFSVNAGDLREIAFELSAPGYAFGAGKSSFLLASQRQLIEMPPSLRSGFSYAPGPGPPPALSGLLVPEIVNAGALSSTASKTGA